MIYIKRGTNQASTFGLVLGGHPRPDHLLVSQCDGAMEAVSPVTGGVEDGKLLNYEVQIPISEHVSHGLF